ncbi:hypothetical protein RB195_003588 [Necator americanus]|uniref:Rubicon Homology domain-containing protein n=1 Tax=Necator americanus TaxID=51031 RepID=A0ABR1DP80_NECAM
MERRLLRKQVSDDENNDDMVEVDKISFTSFGSSDDGDLRMSVRESPVFSNYSDFKSTSELSLHCRVRSVSGNESSSRVPSSSNLGDFSCDSPKIVTTLESEDTEATVSAEPEVASEPAEGSPTSNVFHTDWLDNLYSNSLGPLPEIVQEPYWKTMEKELTDLRQRDASISKDLEESNSYMYSLQLSLCAMEEARWLNEISKDPELSMLIHEIDPKFPLAVNRMPYSRDGCGPSTSEDPGASQDQPLQTFEPYFDAAEQLDAKPVFFVNKRRSVRRHRGGNGSPSKKHEPTWNELSKTALESFVEKETIRDPRIAKWMDDLIQHTDDLMSLPSTSHDNKPETSGGIITESDKSSEWTPLCEDWIFTLWKQDSIRMFCSIKTILEAQNNRCSGCGIRIEKEYMKRVKYCDYYGKVFCQCCHQGSKSIIPARILHTWNFNEFPVCDLAFHFLTDIRDVPAINVCSVAPHIVEKIRVLKHVIVLREKLAYMWDYVKECPDAEETITKYGNLRTLFTSMEQHLLHSLDLFSLSDLVRVHNKDMSTLLEPIVYFAKCHIEVCEHCKKYAATCAYCENAQELLFPFQLEKVYKCGTCGSLSHLKCQTKFRRKMSVDKGCKKCFKTVR